VIEQLQASNISNLWFDSQLARRPHHLQATAPLPAEWQMPRRLHGVDPALIPAQGGLNRSSRSTIQNAKHRYFFC